MSYRFIFEAIGFAFWDRTCRQKARACARREGCVTAAAKSLSVCAVQVVAGLWPAARVSQGTLDCGFRP